MFNEADEEHTVAQRPKVVNSGKFLPRDIDYRKP